MSSKSGPKRRSFTEEFKRDAVSLVVVEGYSISAAAKAVTSFPGVSGNGTASTRQNLSHAAKTLRLKI